MIRSHLKPVKRWLAPHSLRFQLLTRSLFILAALLVLIGALQYVLMKNFLYQNKAETMTAQMRTFPRDVLTRPNLLSDRPAGENAPGMKPEPSRSRGPVLFLPDTSLAYIGHNGSFTDLTEENGAPSPRLSDEEYHALQEQDHRGRTAYRVVRNEEGTEQLIVFRPIGGQDGGVLQMGTATSPIQDVVMRQLLTFGALAFLALAGGLALYLPVLRRTLNPLNKMVRAVERTDAGNLAERFPTGQGQLEIDRLAESFNSMLERLETSFKAEREAKEQMRRFIADASHELRTPLTSIHGFLEVLLRGAADRPEQLYPALNSMHGESKRIKKLVEDLLMLAKLDRSPQLLLKETRLDGLIQEMEPQLRMLAGSRAVRFELTAGIRGIYDSDKIKQVILNLFHNAVQHTDPENGVITVILSSSRNQAELKLCDNGPGITEEHVPHVFERFYRSDASRTRKYGGAGLGLSITKSIVEAHNGIIAVESNPGEGCLFSVRLPAL
ncbi:MULTISPECIES: HAMP domain-containing sensor histidine kinase [unclassified Paenibacillus]|uniref:sensor histidine kinase n=1 Tax=unclassified Paenibacillus TaxID=185978 RepID=UPI001AE60EAA|nr:MULTISPECIES: HAMP domain-containing sensor histidine kinase [unclassified Paenibacillus]MBP1153749.1 two-component system OmpR family sensor kinase [Paenibacillus sp. PvP091]MBP1170866.1 two-component system OmpR family sensor kinase [Paenibacillus sp. PvR098]MBP2441894.1 two-component system OmpR family sensor kinase [Paenibacillus sp. PvP052]